MKLYRDEISEYFGVELQNQYGWQIIALEVNVIHSITILDYPGRKGNLVQHQGWLSVKFHAILFLQIEVGDNMLNYANLNAMEFEALCRDIMERMLGVSLRRFGPGKDGGVDLTDDVMNKNIIVQVKHYQKSGTDALMRALKNELPKVDKLQPKKYYICCSAELSHNRIAELYQHFEPYMDSDRNVITILEIDDFLKDSANRDILKKHSRLWQDDSGLLEDFCQALRDAAREIKNTSDAQKYLLPSNLSTPECFDLVLESRKEDIQRIEQEITRKKPVFVWGFPGLGKTELSIAFARTHNPDRSYLVRYRESMRNTIINLQFAGLDDPDLRTLSNEDRAIVEEKIYRKKRDILLTYPGNSLLIIDNFDSKSKTFQEMIQEPAFIDLLGTNMQIIITTRSQPDDVTPEIQPLKVEYLLKLMRRFSGSKTVSDELLLQLLDACGYHTLSAELIGKAIGNKLKPVLPEYILQKLRNNQLKRAVLPKSRTSQDRVFDEDTIYGHLKTLFDIACLSDTEKNVMCHAALLPTSGIHTCIFLRAEYYEENHQAVEQLISKGWLHVSQEQIISIHPLVCDLVNEELGLSYEKCKFFLYFMFDEAANDQSYRIATASARTWTDASGKFPDRRDRLVEEFGYMEFTNPKEEIEDCIKLAHMIAEVFANASIIIPEWSIPYATKAAYCFRMSHDQEMCLKFSHQALDDIIKKINDNPGEDWLKSKLFTTDEHWAILDLRQIWCPELEERLWDPEYAFLYRNELYMDHSAKPVQVQNIYAKLRFLFIRNQ